MPPTSLHSPKRSLRPSLLVASSLAFGNAAIRATLLGTALLRTALLRTALLGTALLGTALLATTGCGDATTKTGATTGTPKPGGSTSGSAATSTSSTASAKPPLKACEGPTGTVKGVIRIVGDDPPNTPFTYPKGCESAAGTYGKLFRRGQEGQLADAMVSITEYKPCRVPAESDVVKVTIQACTFSTRTIVLAQGQHIELKNIDSVTSYLPHLDGARSPATNVAVPGGPLVKLYPSGAKMGRYWLRDQMTRAFMVAHVWQLPYATARVTGLDGRFEITGVPVGKAKLNVMLPQTKTLLAKTVEIEVKAGETVQDVELVFDAKKDTPNDGHGGTQPGKRPKKPTAPPSSSAAPENSASAPPAPK